MALSGTERLILILVLLVIMTFVVFFELKVMRRKSKEVRVASQKKDEAFNAVLTTRTVMNTVRNRGGNVGNAPSLLDRAKYSMSRGDFDSCVDLCEKARSEMTKPTSRPISESVQSDTDARDRLEAVAVSIVSARKVRTDTDTYAGTKLDGPGEGNYLGAKFEMTAAKADIGRAVSSGIDTATADGLMIEAETAYIAGKYDKALSFAVRARKALGVSASEAIPLREEAEEKVPSTRAAPALAPEPEVYEVEEEQAAEEEPDESQPEKSCRSCGAVLEKDDVFCPVCGAKVPLDACLSCGTKPRPDDKFCRKCGFKIS